MHTLAMYHQFYHTLTTSLVGSASSCASKDWRRAPAQHTLSTYTKYMRQHTGTDTVRQHEKVSRRSPVTSCCAVGIEGGPIIACTVKFK